MGISNYVHTFVGKWIFQHLGSIETQWEMQLIPRSECLWATWMSDEMGNW